ncbi:Immunoglobulin G-binding protein A [Symbiodinium microadriaticum]|uniref:Immunoglobulin G-binding protein A n=1 Tax=Symbiodinium microadriaticum TaxID=2951 RepID=A0A1Q9DKU1_SYMMI|nr:Immunoglobulin G-binding protein A [Symbiodinium microadriaticum]
MSVDMAFCTSVSQMEVVPSAIRVVLQDGLRMEGSWHGLSQNRSSMRPRDGEEGAEGFESDKLSPLKMKSSQCVVTRQGSSGPSGSGKFDAIQGIIIVARPVIKKDLGLRLKEHADTDHRAEPAFLDLMQVRGAAAVVLSGAKIASLALVEVHLLLDEVVNVNVCSAAARDEQSQNKFHEDRGCHLTATGALTEQEAAVKSLHDQDRHVEDYVDDLSEGVHSRPAARSPNLQAPIIELSFLYLERRRLGKRRQGHGPVPRLHGRSDVVLSEALLADKDTASDARGVAGGEPLPSSIDIEEDRVSSAFGVLLAKVLCNAFKALKKTQSNNGGAVAMPTASDVRCNCTFLAEDGLAQFTALSLDFKAAHKGTALTTDTSRIRRADPHRAEMHLRQASKFVLEWLRLCFAQEQPLLSLVGAYIAQPISAADGFADPQWQSRDWTYEAGSQHSIGLLLVQSSFSVEEVVRMQCDANGWMDGWMDGWMEGRKEGRKEGWKDGRMEGWKDGRMEGWKDGRMEGWKDGWMDGWKDGRMEGWKDGRMEGWKDGRMEGSLRKRPPAKVRGLKAEPEQRGDLISVLVPGMRATLLALVVAFALAVLDRLDNWTGTVSNTWRLFRIDSISSRRCLVLWRPVLGPSSEELAGLGKKFQDLLGGAVKRFIASPGRDAVDPEELLAVVPAVQPTKVRITNKVGGEAMQEPLWTICCTRESRTGPDCIDLLEELLKILSSSVLDSEVRSEADLAEKFPRVGGWVKKGHVHLLARSWPLHPDFGSCTQGHGRVLAHDGAEWHGAGLFYDGAQAVEVCPGTSILRFVLRFAAFASLACAPLLLSMWPIFPDHAVLLQRFGVQGTTVCPVNSLAAMSRPFSKPSARSRRTASFRERSTAHSCELRAATRAEMKTHSLQTSPRTPRLMRASEQDGPVPTLF